MDNYEVIVTGYNLNALATAALLTKSNYRVLLLNDRGETEYEKILQTEIGFDTLFYSWDYSVGAMKFVLEKLEIGEIPYDKDSRYIDTVISPHISINRPFGWDAYRESLIHLYPREKEKLHFLFDEMKELGEEWRCLLRSQSLDRKSTRLNSSHVRISYA